MKIILVRTKTQDEAQKSVWDLAMMLENCKEIKAYKCSGKGIVQTSNVTVKFAPYRYTDGLRCDVPVGFGNQGKIMAAGREYPEINSLRDILKCIIEEEKVNE